MTTADTEHFKPQALPAPVPCVRTENAALPFGREGQAVCAGGGPDWLQVGWGPPSPKATLENLDLRWLFCASSRLALGFSATVSLVPLRRGCYGMSGFYEMSRYFGFSLKPLFWGKRLSPWILFPVSQAEKPSRCSLGKISFLPQRGSLGR